MELIYGIINIFIFMFIIELQFRQDLTQREIRALRRKVEELEENTKIHIEYGQDMEKILEEFLEDTEQKNKGE